MRSQLISEFIAKTGSTEGNAVRCLETWDWNVNKAVTDYNGISIDLVLPKLSLNNFISRYLWR